MTERTAVVTGASSGIGAATARALAGDGFRVVCAARREDRITALAKEIGGVAVACDVTDAGERDRLIETVVDRHGRLDGLINNAGVGATAPALKTSTEAFARVLDVTRRCMRIIRKPIARRFSWMAWL